MYILPVHFSALWIILCLHHLMPDHFLTSAYFNVWDFVLCIAMVNKAFLHVDPNPSPESNALCEQDAFVALFRANEQYGKF